MVIAVFGMLEKRGKEIEYLASCIQRRGQKPLVVDLGRVHEPQIKADISREQIAKSAATTTEEIRSLPRHEGQEWVLKGLRPIMRELHSKGQLHGGIALGGTTTAYMASAAMEELPFGAPKFIMCSAAASFPAQKWLQKKDVVLMNTVVHVIGLNWMIKGMMEQAAGAVCAMVESSHIVPIRVGKGTIAMTLYGNAERCAIYVRQGLTDYEVISFHAYGPAEQSMEEMVAQGMFDAVMDLVPRRLGEFIIGGDTSLENALRPICQNGIPYILAPGGVNLLRNAPYQKADFKGRKVFAMDPYRRLAHMNKEELAMVGEEMAKRLNEAKGPVVFLIPLRGWSAVDPAGSEMYDPETDRAFIEAFKKKAKEEIKIREVDAWLEEQKFADEVLAAFNEIMAGRTVK